MLFAPHPTPSTAAENISFLDEPTGLPHLTKFQFHRHHEAPVAVSISQDRDIQQGAQRYPKPSLFLENKIKPGGLSLQYSMIELP